MQPFEMRAVHLVCIEACVLSLCSSRPDLICLRRDHNDVFCVCVNLIVCVHRRQMDGWTAVTGCQQVLGTRARWPPRLARWRCLSILNGVYRLACHIKVWVLEKCAMRYYNTIAQWLSMWICIVRVVWLCYFHTSKAANIDYTVCTTQLFAVK